MARIEKTIAEKLADEQERGAPLPEQVTEQHLRRLFGVESSGKTANDFALRWPQTYRELRPKAAELGLIAL